DGQIPLLSATEVRLDDFSLMIQRQRNAIEAIAGELAHDDLQDGIRADRHQRLRQHDCVRPLPHAHSAGENDRTPGHQTFTPGGFEKTASTSMAQGASVFADSSMRRQAMVARTPSRTSAGGRRPWRMASSKSVIY